MERKEIMRQEIMNRVRAKVEHQRKVRDCEAEGSVYSIEKDINALLCLGLIFFSDYHDMVAILDE